MVNKLIGFKQCTITIVHVHSEIFGISCKNVYILVFLYVQIQECGHESHT